MALEEVESESREANCISSKSIWIQKTVFGAEVQWQAQLF